MTPPPTARLVVLRGIFTPEATARLAMGRRVILLQVALLYMDDP